MTEVRNRRAIIISLPGVVQKSLRAILEAMPGVEVVGLAGGGLSAVTLVHQTQPDVIVIDGTLSEDEILAVLKDIKALHPHIRLVVLTHTTRQQQRILGAGADVALSRWSRTEEWASAVIGEAET